MKCPVCDTKAVCKGSKETDAFFTLHRWYECPECYTRFKSSEKILFSSIPSYVREKFLGEGKRK